MQGMMQVPLWPNTAIFGEKLFELEAAARPAANLLLAPSSLIIALAAAGLGVSRNLQESFLSPMGIGSLGAESVSALIDVLSGSENTEVLSVVMLSNQCNLNAAWTTTLEQLSALTYWDVTAEQALQSWLDTNSVTHKVPVANNACALTVNLLRVNVDTAIGREETTVQFENEWQGESFIGGQTYSGWGKWLNSGDAEQVTLRTAEVDSTFSTSDSGRRSFSKVSSTPGTLIVPDVDVTSRLNLKKSLMELGCPAELFMPGDSLHCLCHPDQTFIQNVQHIVRVRQTWDKLSMEALTVCEIAQPWTVELSRPFSMFLNDSRSNASLLVSRISDPGDAPLPVAAH